MTGAVTDAPSAIGCVRPNPCDPRKRLTFEPISGDFPWIEQVIERRALKTSHRRCHRGAVIPLMEIIEMTTTAEIADKIAAEQSLTKAQAKSIVDSVFKQITEAGAAGAETNIPGFGKFRVKESAEREGRNPATGAAMTIAASKKLTFAPAKAVKDALNG